MPDGSVWLAGDTHPGNDFTQVFLARFDASGRPVVSFGEGGRLVLSVGPSSAHVVALETTPDGKLLFGGDREPDENRGGHGEQRAFVWRIVP